MPIPPPDMLYQPRLTFKQAWSSPGENRWWLLLETRLSSTMLPRLTVVRGNNLYDNKYGIRVLVGASDNTVRERERGRTLRFYFCWWFLASDRQIRFPLHVIDRSGEIYPWSVWSAWCVWSTVDLYVLQLMCVIYKLICVIYSISVWSKVDLYGLQLICMIYSWSVWSTVDPYDLQLICIIYSWSAWCTVDLHDLWLICMIYSWSVRSIVDVHDLQLICTIYGWSAWSTVDLHDLQ